MKDFFAKFLSHDAGPLAQFIKYAIVGGMATFVHISTFFICGRYLFPCLSDDDIAVRVLRKFNLMSLSEGYLARANASRARNAALCNVVAFCISNLFCYILNRLFVFTPGRHSIFMEFLLFCGVSAVSMLIGTVMQTALIAWCKVQTTFAFVTNLISSLAINYLARKFFVFNG